MTAGATALPQISVGINNISRFMHIHEQKNDTDSWVSACNCGKFRFKTIFSQKIE